MTQQAPNDPMMPGAGGSSFADIEGAPAPGAVAAQEVDLLGGYHAAGQPPVLPDGTLTGPWSPEMIEATYYEGDQFRFLRGMRTEDLVRIQEQLAAVGLASKPLYGELDDATVQGFSRLLALSNRSGTPWAQTLTRLSTNPALQDAIDAPEFDAPTYLAPDYASLAQEVKSTFRQRLGRDPDQGEMAQLIGELEGWHKGSYDAQVGAARQNFDNQQAEGEQMGGTVREVDPLARFQEAFESRYAEELDFVEDKDVAEESRNAIAQTTGTLSAMSTGG